MAVVGAYQDMALEEDKVLLVAAMELPQAMAGR